MNGEDAFKRIQGLARSNATRTGRGAPTQEYLIRHALESLLDRLSRSQYVDSFVLKGGILLAAYDVRRATRDADVNAISADVTPAHMTGVMQNLAEMEVGDGVRFDTGNLEVVQIREEDDYPGLRIRIATSIGPWRGTTVVDVSTGDPVVPDPRVVSITRVLGDPVSLYGYAPETVIAEKGVTILERGIASTRWRDYVDIVQLANRGIDIKILKDASQAVANHRNVELQPITNVIQGYGEMGQTKWSAWRRKEHFEQICVEYLDDQMILVAAILDPVFGADSVDL